MKRFVLLVVLAVFAAGTVAESADAAGRRGGKKVRIIKKPRPR